MLKNILKEIGDSRVFSKSKLAQDLDISEAMIDDMISQLIRMGYLAEDLGSPTCQTVCGSCPYARSCNINPIKMYYLSEKGKNYLK